MEPAVSPDFTFRLRFRLAPTSGLNIDVSSMELLSDHFPNPIVLKPRLEPEKVIKETKELVLKSSGWSTEVEANQVGNKCLDALLRAMARVRVGVDLGERSGKSYFTKEGIAHFEKQLGKRVLDDHPGLMVYETNPLPMHMGMNANLEVLPDNVRFLQVLNAAMNSEKILTNTERLALHLFHASFFQTSPDSRLLMLVMAIEACIIQSPRSKKEIEHLDKLINLTKQESNLSDSEKESLAGCLRELKNISISQAGRRLIREKLGKREYKEKPAEKFFTECYDIRSRLVHGPKKSSKKRFPTFEEVNFYVADLEVMVSDLLSEDLLEVG